jgi:hypothetical protein
MRWKPLSATVLGVVPGWRCGDCYGVDRECWADTTRSQKVSHPSPKAKFQGTTATN